jgi:hypothetical protein
MSTTTEPELYTVIASHVPDETSDGSTLLAITLELAPTDLCELDIALVALAQYNPVDLSKMQVTAPARFAYERANEFRIRISEQMYIEDIKASRRLVNKPQPVIFPKDSADALELQNARNVCIQAGPDVEEMKRDYRNMQPRVEARYKHLFGDEENAAHRATRKDEVLVYTKKALTVFLCSTHLQYTFQNIHRRNGNPAVITIYGHGGAGDLVAPDGGHDHVNGEAFANLVSDAGLRPKLVLFVCCLAHNVASGAHNRWSQIRNDSPCVFIGPFKKVPAEDIFSGESIPARYLAFYLYSMLCMKVHGSFRCEFTFSETCRVTWVRPKGTEMNAVQFLGLFLICILDNCRLDTSYYNGSVIMSGPSGKR